MPRSLADFAVFAAPAVFVVLWASGFIGAKFGLAYAEPLTFLTLRMAAIVALLAVVIALTRPKWPNGAGVVHSALTGLMVHGLYLGGVFVSIENGLSAGLIALIVSLQPVLDLNASPTAGWASASCHGNGSASLLGLVGVYLIVRENMAAGGAQPLAWVGGCGRADRHHRRHALSEALRRRHRLAAGMLLQYMAAGILFALGAYAFETAHRAMDAAIHVRAVLAGLRAVVRRHLAVVFSDPPFGGDAAWSACSI